MDQIFYSPLNGVPSESKLATYMVILHAILSNIKLYNYHFLFIWCNVHIFNQTFCCKYCFFVSGFGYISTFFHPFSTTNKKNLKMLIILKSRQNVTTPTYGLTSGLTKLSLESPISTKKTQVQVNIHFIPYFVILYGFFFKLIER